MQLKRLSFIKLIHFLFLFIPLFSFAQQGALRVKVLEAGSSDPVMGASVTLLNPTTKAPVLGRQTSTEGVALMSDVKTGRYILQISFVGMVDYLKDNVLIEAGKTLDLGTISLEEAGKEIGEVVVQGRVPELQLGIDKKVFDVSQSMVSAGGTAQDLLGNVPTLQMDADGSLSLRGSSVRILIDGKESAMAGSDVNKLLQSLPADAIAKVEIITNPSAKYDAEGQTGIVNIVLKKNIRTGLNGTANVTAGSYDTYNAGVTLNYRNNKFNYFGNYNFRRGNNPGENGGRTVELINGEETAASSITNTSAESFRKGMNNSFRLGADYYANDKTTFSLGGNMSIRDNKRGDDILYTFENQFNNLSNRVTRQKENDLGYDVTFDFKRTLKREGEELTANVTYGSDKEDGTNTFYQTYDVNSRESRRTSTTYEKGKNWNMQVDYVLPLGENHKFEAGYRSIIRNSDENQLSDTLLSNNNWGRDYRASNYFDMESGVHALYANYQRQLGSRFGVQVGLRAEDAYLKTKITGFDSLGAIGPTNNGRLDYFRLYPSVFLSYNVNQGGDKVQLSYSRRVQRPRGWQVNPFVSLSDELNIRQGNPNLLPEDIHSVELSFAKFYDTWNFVTSAYYRRVNDMIQPLQLGTDDPIANEYLAGRGNATFMRWENMGNRNSGGVEIVSKVNIFKWWDATANVNLFYLKVNPDKAFNLASREGFAWSSNLTTNVKFAKSTSLQLRGDYRTPMNTAQGKMHRMYGVDAAIRQDVLKGKGSLLFNVRDLFDSRRFSSESYLATRYMENYFRWSKRTVSLTFSYRFGLQDLSKNKRNHQESAPMEGEGGY
ncbi:TonB-dependent receptor domain-containing protein [Sphingobacterium sp. Mn56C]|uniref:TonB-dependent receptor domain-containing protein n=1 Tax=Sphingobacterium sp. Mn56C TaxID=3395261 RepID=UPI003BD9AA51